VSVEAARRQNCNSADIQTFINHLSQIIDQDPDLLITCDDPLGSSRKRFHVLIPDGYLRLEQCWDRLPHFSAMCTISGQGQISSQFILPDRVTLPGELAELCNLADFVSTESGSMVQQLGERSRDDPVQLCVSDSC
jgi:hypothetical protein